VRIRVLGPLVVTGALDRPLPLGSPKQRTLLALLLVRAGNGVTAEALLNEVWDHDPPDSGMANLRSYASGLRRVLDSSPGSAALARSGSGYVLTVRGEYDLTRWRELTRSGRAALADGDLEKALADLRDGLGLWRGPALADVQLGLALTAWQTGIHEQRMTAAEDLVEALLRFGQVGSAIEQAGDLLAEAPTRERAAGLLMRALYHGGDLAAALATYDRTRRVLAETLGVEPGEDLRRLQRQMLKRDLPPPPAVVNPTAERAERVVPRQLPTDVAGFTGRAELLEALDGLSTLDSKAAVVVSAVAGTPGVGKTALAVHWAHRVAARFPDGHVYVNLRGFAPGGAAMGPSEAVRALLEAFGVAPQRIPASLEAQVGMYRGLLDGRRVLLVLDNARDAEQVRPLLPGTPGCVAVVTSRSRLSGLVATEGAHPLTVDLLTAAEARDMLAQRLGDQRVEAEPEAIDEIITWCGRLPMALAIVSARAVTHPAFSLATLATQLRQGRLDGLENGDPVTNIRAVFSWSYQALTPAAAELFRLLGLHPGLDITTSAAASLASLPVRQVHRALAELAHAHLLIEHTPGRYTFHDLLSAYAAELAEEMDAPAARQAATRRVLDHYLHTAYTADRLMRPDREQITLDPPAADVTPEAVVDHTGGLAWFAAEHPVLLAAIQHAVHCGLYSHAWQLAWTLENWFDWRGHWHELAAAQKVALDAAARSSDPVGQAHTHRGLARVYTRTGRYEEALTHLRTALDLFTQIGDQAGQAATYRSLGIVLARQGQHGEALKCDEAALDLHRATGDSAAQAVVLNNMGYHHGLIGNYEKALAYCQDALTVHQKFGARDGEARTWGSLGYAHSHLGNHAEAVRCYRHCVDILDKLGDRSSKADNLKQLGDAHYAAGDIATARIVWLQALDLLEELGRPDAIQLRARLEQG
jgi:DNA-binding SARP family transcriptional activator/Tfp pilus assembly protein PilF